jgi:hypothetical protein
MAARELKEEKMFPTLFLQIRALTLVTWRTGCSTEANAIIADYLMNVEGMGKR